MSACYDVQDYLEEFAELTSLGFSVREIIARSDPSQTWFHKHVFPHVHKALCISCRGFFDLSTVTRGTECSVICRNSYTGFGNQGMRQPVRVN